MIVFQIHPPIVEGVRCCFLFTDVEVVDDNEGESDEEETSSRRVISTLICEED